MMDTRRNNLKNRDFREQTSKTSIHLNFPTISDLVLKASRVIGPVWPLKNAVACNPFLGMEHIEFWDAIKMVQSRISDRESLLQSDQGEVNRHFIKWIQAFLDEGQASWPMPDRHLGFYRCFLNLAPHDHLLIQTQREEKILASLPKNPEEAIRMGMQRFEIPSKDQETYLATHLAQLPGWAGYVKWASEWRSPPSLNPIDLVEFLAVRIAIALITEEKKQKSIPQTEEPSPRKEIESQEKQYRDEWVAKLSEECRKEGFYQRKKNAEGQLVFCIDVRSEPFRKKLESLGNWETFGFAGFFGIPISLKTEKSTEEHPSCPVLLKPKHTLLQTTKQTIFGEWIEVAQKRFIQFYQGLKYQFGTPFALAESIGPASGIWMAFKSLAPKLCHRIDHLCSDEKNHKFCSLNENIPLKEQVEYAKSALSMIGLTHDFAPIVIFCGHGSTTENNPHASSLHCGACGGNRGGANARLISDILNSDEVREELAKTGIAIPKDTYFLGAEHDTATDDLTLLSDKIAFEKHPKLLHKLKADLKTIREGNKKNIDWSEVRPEWGLAKNGGFLVGPRTLSENLDLEASFFLHSYNWTLDPEGLLLETILTAPMVVAEWINTQYFFSTLYPIAFGSGSKITHNVVGKIGVMQGTNSDLMHGLPLQSVYLSDTQTYHNPIRLLSVVFSPKERIEAIVKKHTILQHLIFNHWITLVAIDPRDRKSYKLEKGYLWDEISG